MSLDVSLVVIQPTTVFTQNITHNLGPMAAQVELGTTTLYNLLWRPEELNIQYVYQLVQPLRQANDLLLANPEYFEQWNSTNGWGNYQNLCDFVREYLRACLEYPQAEVRACR